MFLDCGFFRLFDAWDMSFTVECGKTVHTWKLLEASHVALYSKWTGYSKTICLLCMDV